MAAGPLGLLAAVSATASPARAQTSEALSSNATAQNPPTTSAAMGEVVVTARKRQETLLDVPESVTALSGTTLERSGVQSVSGLIGSVPSLYVAQNTTFGPAPNETFLVIRGVGATAANDPAVGTFVDGVYQTSLAFDADFLDVKSVEVLRGPQGALFGRNTEGGAISILTDTPGDATTGKLLVEGGSFGTVKVGATASTPLIADKLYGGVSLKYDHTDGFLHNETLDKDQDDADRYGLRLTLRATPVENLEVILRASAAADRLGYVGFGVPDDGGRRYVTLDDQKRTSTVDNYGGSVTVNYKLPSVTLTSITGLGKIGTNYFFDYDSNVYPGDYQNQLTDQNLVSQELRASGKIGAHLDWLLGYYYFGESFGQQRTFGLVTCGPCTVPPFFNAGNILHDETSFNRHGNAGFGQLIYHPLPRLDLTAGARYSTERTIAHQSGVIFLPGLGAQDNYNGVASHTFDNFSPSGSAAYHWTPALTTYVTISRGYKPGGFDKFPGSSAAIGIPFRSETSTNYEAGIKAELLDRRLYVQTDGFYVSLKNQQLATQVASPTTGVPVGATANVGQSSSRGFEFEGTFYPVRPLRLSLSTAYVDAVFDRFQSPVGTFTAGDSFPYIPKWTVSTQGEYTQSLPNNQSLVYGAYYRFVGPYYTGTGAQPFDPILDIPSHGILDFRLSWHVKSYELAFFVNNVTDQFSIVSRYQPAFFTYTRDTVLPPRQFGARAKFDF